MLACDVCGSPANGFECDWGITGFVPTSVSALKIGATVRRWKVVRVTDSVAKVAGIAATEPGWVQLLLAIQTPESIRWAAAASKKKASPEIFVTQGTAFKVAWKAARFKKINVKLESEIMSLGRRHCGKRVCDACMIERDPNRMVLCRDHWFAWEKVA